MTDTDPDVEADNDSPPIVDRAPLRALIAGGPDLPGVDPGRLDRAAGIEADAPAICGCGHPSADHRPGIGCGTWMDDGMCWCEQDPVVPLSITLTEAHAAGRVTEGQERQIRVAVRATGDAVDDAAVDGLLIDLIARASGLLQSRQRGFSVGTVTVLRAIAALTGEALTAAGAVPDQLEAQRLRRALDEPADDSRAGRQAAALEAGVALVCALPDHILTVETAGVDETELSIVAHKYVPEGEDEVAGERADLAALAAALPLIGDPKLRASVIKSGGLWIGARGWTWRGVPGGVRTIIRTPDGKAAARAWLAELGVEVSG